MKLSFAALAGLLSLALSSQALAHHGFAAHYDPDRLIRIEGTVRQFDFINPHGLLFIDSVNEDGEPVVYKCDLQAAVQLVRRGVDETLFTVGEPIVVEGYPARREPYGCEYGKGYLADGSTFTMRSTDQARTQFAANREVRAPGSSGTIFGKWIRPGMFGDASGRGPTTGIDSITAAGEAAGEAFDPALDNPAIQCMRTSPVWLWGPPGLATEITEVDGNVMIYHESMDTTRVIPIGVDSHPEGIEPSEMGNSIGRWEGDTLVIDSIGFTAGVIRASMLHSDQMWLEERVSVDAES
ncbi:MAG: hypothetical protein GWN29_08345, partial [Gammaproteobacteria bacterium]|nr:hypothetical protein [Gammaproteobacteria bacterium]